MAISIHWPSSVITIPQADLTLISGTLYELDTETFREALKALEDDEQGITYPKTHDHNTTYTVAGVTYARAILILFPYTVTFEDGSYSVRLANSNNNIFDPDILNYNSVQVIGQNSAGLQVVTSGSGVTEQDKDDIRDRILSDSTAFDGADIGYMNKVIRNRKVLEKTGDVWYLIIYDDNDVDEILKKAIKDKDGSDITDLEAGVLAQELKTSV
jgi:hypothetical protein